MWRPLPASRPLTPLPSPRLLSCQRVQAYQSQNPAKSWRVILIRARGELLGYVEAPDRERAAAVAVKLFDLDQDQRSRLLIRERV